MSAGGCAAHCVRPKRARGHWQLPTKMPFDLSLDLVVALFVAAAAGWLVAQFRLRDRAPRSAPPRECRAHQRAAQPGAAAPAERGLPQGPRVPAQRRAGQGARSLPADGRRRQRNRRDAFRARQPLSAARRSGARDPHPREHHGAPVAQRRASPGGDVRAWPRTTSARDCSIAPRSRFVSSPRATRGACRRCATCCASTSSSATGIRRSQFTTS